MKLKHIFQALLVSGGILSAVGCADSVDLPVSEENLRDGYINITLRSSKLTRATEPGMDTYNENRIETAVLLFYPDDGTAGSEETYRPTVSQVFTRIGETSSATLHVVLTEPEKKRLFGDDGTRTCRVNVFSNLPASVIENITPETTADAIKEMTVSSPFEKPTAPESFVMDGTGDVRLASDGKSASGTVDLQRAASKITLSIRVPATISTGEGEDEVVWESQRDNMTAAISNGVKVSSVVPSNHANEDDDYYSLPTQKGTENGPRNLVLKDGASADDVTGYPYVVEVPFYTYPNSWEENADETHRTFLTLMVPWREGADGSYRTSYYQVPVNRETSISRNVSYNVNLNVGVLGSFVPDEPFDLVECSYTAVDWSEEQIDVTISDYRYLVIDTDYYVLNNEPSISIPVYSSHPVTVTNVTATYYRYAVTSQGNETPVKITQEMNKATGDFTGGRTAWGGTQIPSNDGKTIWQCEYIANTTTDANGTLNLNHEMIQWQPHSRTGQGTQYNPYYYPVIEQRGLPSSTINVFTPTSDAEYSRFEFLITIQHIGNSAYSQTIKVVQYPAMYIEAIQNYPTAGSSAATGNMYVNRNQQSNNADDWIVARGLNGKNKNPNQYILTVGNLPANTDYIIGDPRQQVVKNFMTATTTSTAIKNLKTAWYSTTPMNGTTSRGLEFYYPTQQGVDYKYFIAPKVLIASSYGVCDGPISYSDAQKRCAGYQEMSRPAGRWRIPTFAEMQYMLQLSLNDYIPTLYNSESEYWCAQGIITTTLNSDGELNNPVSITNNNTAFVRCVYDEWYWGNDTIPGTGTGAANTKTYPFTWGDREIDFSTEQTRSSAAKGGVKSAAGIIDRIRNK